MGYRRFTDRDGNEWDVRAASRSFWEFIPAGDNRERQRSVEPPGYERDPFELSVEELQGLFERSSAPTTRSARNPFKD